MNQKLTPWPRSSPCDLLNQGYCVRAGFFSVEQCSDWAQRLRAAWVPSGRPAGEVACLERRHPFLWQPVEAVERFVRGLLVSGLQAKPVRDQTRSGLSLSPRATLGWRRDRPWVPKPGLHGVVARLFLETTGWEALEAYPKAKSVLWALRCQERLQAWGWTGASLQPCVRWPLHPGCLLVYTHQGADFLRLKGARLPNSLELCVEFDSVFSVRLG